VKAWPLELAALPHEAAQSVRSGYVSQQQRALRTPLLLLVNHASAFLLNSLLNVLMFDSTVASGRGFSLVTTEGIGSVPLLRFAAIISRCCSEIWSAIRGPSTLYNGCPWYQLFLLLNNRANSPYNETDADIQFTRALILRVAVVYIVL
jgi:hypothetical protein